MVSSGGRVRSRRGIAVTCAWLLSFAALGVSRPVAAQVQVKPWFLIVVDTSGSMQDNCTNGATNWNDGATACTNCAGGCASTFNSCGLRHTRINDAKCALKNILNSTGDAEFALMQFKHACRPTCDSRSGGDAASTCDGEMRVALSTTNYSLLPWVDNTCTSDCTGSNYTTELYAYGYTPIGQSLVRAKQYFANTSGTGSPFASGFTSPTAPDTYAGCRPVAVIMLTDGQENCGGNGVTAATSLRSTVIPSPAGNKTIDIKTYAVGFGLTPGDTNIENLANAGGTDAPGAYKGFYAQNEEALSAALNSIITNSQLTERCDGVDNDCDARIDEDNPKYCDVRAIRTANPLVPNPANPSVLVPQSQVDSRVAACTGATCPAVPGVASNASCAAPEWSLSSTCSPANILCSSPGELCNTLDDDCDGTLDEGAAAIAESNEVCGDNVDNDCDLFVDEDCNGCISQPEICNNADEDCDTRIDETLSRGCGTMVGRCTPGMQTCSAGAWSTCSGNNPIAETCNNIDDDCDGVIDGMTRPCGTSSVGTCRLGTETCTAGAWGSCVGAVSPATEVCDTLDNDCNASTADGSADPRVNQMCGNNRGVCQPGTTACQAGEIRCNGATAGTTELCDGLDNDCDGNVDEGVAATDTRINKPCIAPGGVFMGGPVAVNGQCRTGTSVCSGGMLMCPGYVGPTMEICDGLDQDCDTNTDEGVAVSDPRIGQTCGTTRGVCEPGVLVCTAGVIDCTDTEGGPESCNELDDDCDGLTDENLPPTPTPCDTTGHNGVGLCQIGQEACIGGDIVCEGEITQTPEICDGLDNDCDGSTDEGNPGGGNTCGTNAGECDAGTTQCMSGTLVCIGEEPPVLEVCDGLDNDCDGVTDEGNPQGGARCDYVGNTPGQSVVGTCRTRLDPEEASQQLTEACGECRFGTEVCQGGDIVCIGAVGPIAELCDGLDNDCDSPCVLDNSDPQNPVLKCPEDPCELPESDPGYLDCDGKIDEGVMQSDPNVGVPCSGGSGECREGLAQCVGGVISCVGGQIPVDEICNDKDDDCDTVIDEGFMLGSQCGTDVGECEQGTVVCNPETGDARCNGEVGPRTEVCDALDNDCDGVVDNGNPEGGGSCGKDEGECQQGMLVCSAGRLICDGENSATPEVCDCLDNDCDGTIDEDPSANNAICPSGSACAMCQCAQECRDAGEFAQTCPAGKVPLNIDNACRCVGERCQLASCAAQTLRQAEQVLCGPNLTDIGSCTCRDNECAPLCSGVVCTNDLVCDPKDGRCKEKTCLLAQFACDDGEYCDVESRTCLADACAGKDCGDQGCRDGECIASCANVSCDSGQKCRGGACVEDKCANVQCAGLTVCSPESGTCVAAGACVSFPCKPGFVCDSVAGTCAPDACLRTTCPRSQVCEEGECQLRCALPMLDCNDECINPQSSRQYCGAKADCLGDDNDGTTCARGEVCSNGSCSDSCQAGFIACEGGCIDPQTDDQHCGASGDCTGSRTGVECLAGYSCTAGECVLDNQPDAGQAMERPARRVSLNGGGGCACEIAAPRSAAPDLRWVAGFGLWGLVFFRRRALRVLRGSGALVKLLLLCLLFAAGGCKVSTFCLDCDDGSGGGGGRAGLGGVDNPDASPGAGRGGTGEGGEGGETGEGGEGGEGSTVRDGGVAGDGGLGPDSSIECLALESCNGRDDDCDGNIDEGTDPASENIDTDTDLQNCGACGRRCALDHAFSRCSSGDCQIDLCDPEYLDFDETVENGCEYRCRKTSDDDTLCNRRDDDCDTHVDEDVDFDTDLNNCGSCNNACKPPNATEGGRCESGSCRLDATACNAGFIDVDGVYANGCEYQCTRTNDGDELCNGKDDDCDKKIDEDVSATDPQLGQACGDDTGECSAGQVSCLSGNPSCRNSQGPVTEICNGKDDDCDSRTDESFPQLGLPCGNDLGECVRGNQQCVSGMLVCANAVAGTDEVCNGKDDDCDGRNDEESANVGRSCVTNAGGGLVFDPAPAQGECRLGVVSCTPSGVLACSGEVRPKDELCDDKDQDCDGDNVNGVDMTDPLMGSACGIDLGECRFGSYACMNEARVCLNGRLGVAELCNGRDDDCDGKYDETDTSGATPVPPQGAGVPCRIDAAGTVHAGVNETVQGECRLGTSVCVGGSIGCQNYKGPAPELCDNLDQDCDGNNNNGVSSTDARLGQACAGNNTGQCSAGTTYCNSGAIACQGVVGMSAELCDGLDNDCDGSTADDGEAEPTRGMTCGIDTGDCVRGTMQCSSGSMVCSGQTAAAPETCNGSDNDCDGAVDEDFQLMTNVNRCGTCSNVCSFANATPRCVNGMCQIASCLPNYHDNPSVAGMDCSVGPCTISGNEICNGVDDNCNGSVDEGLTAPTGVCNTVGACAGAVATCQGSMGWVCNKLPVAELCDAVDNNCNGINNEGFAVGATCSAAGVGACATPGTLRCNAGGTATFCADAMGNQVVSGSASATESCNGKDDDCDGNVDEPCPTPGSPCVTDSWVSLTGGVEVYKYEASRPDATLASSGALTTRACSTLDKLPWTNLTYLQALAACKAADPTARLCTEGEWEQACMNDAGGSCTWAFPDHPACNAWSSTQCNGLDYNSTPAIQASGRSGATNTCYRGRSDTPAGQIFELSGNVKEYVMQRSTGGIPVRGGATNNTQDGLRCDFDFSVWPNNSAFTNVGFRCCRSATPLATVCSTFELTGQSTTNPTLAVSTLDVPLHGRITDLNVVNVRGSHASMSQVDYMEIVGPDATAVRLLNSNTSCNDTYDNWSFVFDSDAGSALPAAGAPSPCGNSLTYRPAQTLTVFNTKSALGTWTFRVHDSNSAGTQGNTTNSPRITSWGVRVCVNPNP